MAFFSNSGEAIYSGAAGLSGTLRAFKDGSLGAMATMIDGSERCKNRPDLPECQNQGWHSNARTEPVSVFRPANFSITSIYQKKYQKAVKVKRPMQPVRGTLMAYQDGVLGGLGYGPGEAFHDGSLGQSGAGPLRSYQDGSLGFPLFLETADGIREIEEPVTIRHGTGEYFTGTGEYFSGMAGCGSCGLGQTASGPALDLADPATILEIKSLVAYSPLMVANVNVPETQADLNNSRWTPYTTQLVDALLTLSAMQLLAAYDAAPAGSKPKNADGTEQSKDQYAAQIGNDLSKAFPAPERFPTYDGVMLLRALMGNAQISVPKVDAFITAAGTSGGVVLPPKTSAQATLMGVGVGVAVLALLGGLYLSGKKKRS